MAVYHRHDDTPYKVTPTAPTEPTKDPAKKPPVAPINPKLL